MPSPQTWEYAATWVAEDEPVLQARARAEELGCPPVSPATGAALRLLAAATDARAVVEIGTGAGVSGAWLLSGMHPDGILTSIDVEAENQRAARATFAALDVPHGRARLINGRALDVLPRLTDSAYDLVFVDGEKAEYHACLHQALRLLRPGGVVAFDNVLWHDRVADPSQRDRDTVALRELAVTVRDEARLVPALLPVGDGLLAAVLRDVEPAEEPAEQE